MNYITAQKITRIPQHDKLTCQFNNEESWQFEPKTQTIDDKNVRWMQEHHTYPKQWHESNWSFN